MHYRLKHQESSNIEHILNCVNIMRLLDTEPYNEPLALEKTTE